MKWTRVFLAAIFMLGLSFLWSSQALSATDGVYTLSETIYTWDGTDANRTKAATADYDYTYGDEASLTYTLPWSFTFYGQNYSQITADTNGNIWFGAVGGGKVIAVWNEDLSSYYHGGAFIQRKINPERVVIQWQTETYTDEGEQFLNDLEVVLFQTGSIRFDYRTFGPSVARDAGSGISSGGGQSLSLTANYGMVTGLAGRSFNFAASPPDTAAPTVTGFTMPATSTALTFSVTAFTATDDKGVTGYLITESSTPPAAGAAGWTVSAPASYTAASAGSHTLYPWAKDAAGNVSSVYGSPQTIVIDTTAPAVTGFSIPSTSPSRTVAVTAFTATDNSGVTGYLITESSTPPSSGASGWSSSRPASYRAATVGRHTLYPWAKDAAGNVSAVYGSPRTVVISCAGTGC